jgi:predicted transcriptional regulator of viral defense system
MTTRPEWRTAIATARDRGIVLGIVNTLQPVPYDVIAETTSGHIERDRLKAVVGSLRSQGVLIRLPTGEYVVARLGKDAFGGPRVKIQRDISRMRYLFERSKGGGAKP